MRENRDNGIIKFQKRYKRYSSQWLKKDLVTSRGGWIHFPVRWGEEVGMGIYDCVMMERNWRISWMVGPLSLRNRSLGCLLRISRYGPVRRPKRWSVETLGKANGLQAVLKEVTNGHVWLPAFLVNSYSFLKAQFRCTFLWDVVYGKSPLFVLVSLESPDLNWVSGMYQVFNKGLPDEWVLRGIVWANSHKDQSQFR